MERHIEFKLEEDGQLTFQPIAENGEGQGISEPYANLSNLRRGAKDLFPEDVMTYSRVMEHRDDDREKDETH